MKKKNFFIQEKNRGAMPSQLIRQMLKVGFIKNASTDNIQPASLDLRVSKEIYRLEGTFLPGNDERVRIILKEIDATPHNPRYPFERGVTYLARLEESFHLPSDVYGYANPKSSTGRDGLQVRTICDYTARYDSVPSGHRGELWLAIMPYAFPVIMKPKEALAQLRFFNQDTRLLETELKTAVQQEKLIWDAQGRALSYKELVASDNDGSVILTVDLSSKIAGWECLGINKILNLSRRDQQPIDFFHSLKVNGQPIKLKKGGFYILHSREYVRVPPHLACEMAPMDSRSGEFRAHWAGFIDPGWGWGSGNGRGRPLVLEVVPMEDLVLRHGQPVGKIRFEKVIAVPEFSYDSRGTYINILSAPLLSKRFRMNL